MAIGLRLELSVQPAGLQRCRAPRLQLRFVPGIPGGLLELVGEALDEIGAAQRIGRAGHAGLECQDLLRAKRDSDRVHRRQPQRLVVGRRGECLDATEDRGHRLVGDPDDVVQRLLCRLGTAEGVAEDIGAQALGVLRVEAGLEELVPHPPSGAELGDLLEDVKVGRQEEVDRRRERIDVEPPLE